MDPSTLYHFLFETYAGIGVLVGASLIICIIIAALLELRTRRTFVDRGDEPEEDEWALYDDEDGTADDASSEGSSNEEEEHRS